MKKLEISFCTVSMDRLHHLKLTLRQNIIDNINYGNIEFIVIDYNSRDGLCDWVLTNMKKYLELGILKVYRADEPVYFHRCHSRNMAFKMGSGDNYIIKIKIYFYLICPKPPALQSNFSEIQACYF